VFGGLLTLSKFWN